ncbi:MAG: hypothetical protein ACLPX9_14565 [Rhodomicrobium sp.]
MMPLEKTSAICRETKLLVEQSKQELARLRKSHCESEAYNEAARAFLQTANWTPQSRFEETRPAGGHSPLPVTRTGDPGWNKRAQETRFFAGKVRDAYVRRELMAIAELYDRLSGAEPAGYTSPGIDAIAA